MTEVRETTALEEVLRGRLEHHEERAARMDEYIELARDPKREPDANKRRKAIAEYRDSAEHALTRRGEVLRIAREMGVELRG